MDYSEAKAAKAGTKLKFNDRVVIAQEATAQANFLYEDGSKVMINPKTVKITEVKAKVEKPVAKKATKKAAKK